MDDDAKKAKLAQMKQSILQSRTKRKLFYSERPENPKEIFNKKIILKKGEAGLLKDSSARLAKIRKQTMFLVKLNKTVVRDNIEALRAFYHSTKEEKGEDDIIISKREDLVELVVTLSQRVTKVVVRPIKLQLKSQIFDKAYGTKGALVVGEKDKITPTWGSWAEDNGLKVSRTGLTVDNTLQEVL